MRCLISTIKRLVLSGVIAIFSYGYQLLIQIY